MSNNITAVNNSSYAKIQSATEIMVQVFSDVPWVNTQRVGK